MARRPPAPTPYLEAMLQTRALMGQLEADAARRVLAALRAYAGALERAIRSGVATSSEQASFRAVMAAAEVLDAQLGKAIADGRLVSFSSTVQAWEASMRQIAASRGIDGATLGAIRGTPLTMLGQFATMQSGKHWRTLIREKSIASGLEANAILLQATQEGVGAEELARRMRRYVTGAEPFVKLFEEVPTVSGSVVKIDLRRNPQRAGATQAMVHSSRRIAFSELHNGRSEAEVQHMDADPFVAAVRWTLSPVRSTVGWVPPDECDYLATNDVYGLGPGIYPVRAVPAPPHPWDRCEKMPVSRATNRIREPKPTGVAPSRSDILTIGTVPDIDRLSPAAEQRMRENAWAAISFGKKAAELAAAA